MLVGLTLALLTAGCGDTWGDTGPTGDGGVADGGLADGGAADGGHADGGGSDGGAADGGGTSGVYDVPDAPIVVFWTIDALSSTAAGAVDLCGRFQSQLSGYGLDALCLQGAVTPSSWTIESHVRLFWPTHTIGAKRSSITPDCEDKPYLKVIADRYGGAYFFGAENSKFGQAADLADCGGVSPWVDDADQWWITPDVTPQEQAEIPLDDRPPWKAIGALLDETAKGRAATMFLNDFEAGGHMPRCWWNPDTEACTRIYDLAVSLGVVDESMSPYDAFLAPGFWQDLQEYTRDDDRVTSKTLVSDFDASINEQVDGLWRDRTEPRIARLLDGLKAQGRLDDLVLVITGDHGEAPCAPQVITNERDCSHGHVPSEWTAAVPLMISPPEAAYQLIDDGWLPPDGTPFSSMRISYGLTDLLTGAIPDTWPEPEPIGEATSWVCYEHTVNRNRMGMKLIGDQTMRCTAGGCGFYSWDLPIVDIEAGPRVLNRNEVSPEIMEFAESAPEYQSWFTKACMGEATD